MGEVISQNFPTPAFLKLREKWFFIGYIENTNVFQKKITSLQNYRKRSKLLRVSNL